MHLFLAAALIASIPPAQAPEPNRQPELAVARGLTTLVFGSGHSIWFAASYDNGRTFGAITKVAHVPFMALGRHRGPQVVISGKTVVISAIYGWNTATGPHTHGLPTDGDLVAWRSQDEGHTWSTSAAVNDAAGSAREGLHSMASGNAGQIATVWLDLRSPGTRLYGAYSRDAGVTWSKNVLLYESPDGTICQCCRPSITSSGTDRFAVMFRNAVGGRRDMYVTEWKLDGPIEPAQKIGLGSWPLDVCPMDGGGIARQGEKLVTAWRRDRTIFLDEVGRPEIELARGKDVALTISQKGAWVAWVDEDGVEVLRPGAQHPLCVSHTGSYPTLAGLPDGSVLAAWEQNGKIQVERLE